MMRPLLLVVLHGLLANFKESNFSTNVLAQELSDTDSPTFAPTRFPMFIPTAVPSNTNETFTPSLSPSIENDTNESTTAPSESNQGTLTPTESSNSETPTLTPTIQVNLTVAPSATESPISYTMAPSSFTSNNETNAPTGNVTPSPTTHNKECDLDFQLAMAVYGIASRVSECTEFNKCPDMLELLSLITEVSKSSGQLGPDILFACSALDILSIVNDEVSTREEIFDEYCVDSDPLSFVYQGKQCLKSLGNLSVRELLKIFSRTLCYFDLKHCISSLYSYQLQLLY